jgi:peptidoglycan/LPS O-acetylase OafA/YrhL
MEQANITASPKLRAAFFIGAAVILALWGWSLVPAIENWNNPNEDGFSFVPAFYGTLTFLPLGLIALLGGISGRGKRVAKARTALIIGLILIAVIVAFEIFSRIYNASLD